MKNSDQKYILNYFKFIYPNGKYRPKESIIRGIGMFRRL